MLFCSRVRGTRNSGQMDREADREKYPLLGEANKCRTLKCPQRVVVVQTSASFYSPALRITALREQHLKTCRCAGLRAELAAAVAAFSLRIPRDTSQDKRSVRHLADLYSTFFSSCSLEISRDSYSYVIYACITAKKMQKRATFSHVNFRRISFSNASEMHLRCTAFF